MIHGLRLPRRAGAPVRGPRARAWGVALAVVSSAVPIGGCSDGKAPLGPPDSYVVYQPGLGEATAPGNAASLRTFKAVPVEDPRAAPVHRQAADGFLGELLRTDYLAKALIRVGWQGKTFA